MCARCESRLWPFVRSLSAVGLSDPGFFWRSLVVGVCARAGQATHNIAPKTTIKTQRLIGVPPFSGNSGDGEHRCLKISHRIQPL